MQKPTGNKEHSDNLKTLIPPPPVINSLLHRGGYQPSARGFGQYWGLKSCRPINTLCTPVSAPSQLLHLPHPAGGLAHGFPFSTACLHSPLFSFFHQLTLCPWLLPSFPSSLTHSFLYVLAWQNVLIGNKLWEGSQSEVETALDLPLMVSLLSSVGSVTSLFAVAECTCLQRRSVETTRRHPDGYQQSEHDRKRCKTHNSKRDLTFTVCLKEC